MKNTMTNTHSNTTDTELFDPFYELKGEDAVFFEKELEKKRALLLEASRDYAEEVLGANAFVTPKSLSSGHAAPAPKPALSHPPAPDPAAPSQGLAQRIKAFTSLPHPSAAVSMDFKLPMPAAKAPMHPTDAPLLPGDVLPAVSCRPSRSDPAPRPIDLLNIIKQAFILRVKDQDVYFYNGKNYQRISRQFTERLIMKHCKDQVALSGSAGIVKKTYELLLIDPELAILDFAINRDLVGFQNGVLRLSDGCLLPHSPDLFITYVLNCNYLHAPCHIPCPNFEHFLESATGGDPVLKERLLEVIGYCLTSDTAAKAFFAFQGVGDSGKSLLTEHLLRSLFPPDKVVSMDIHDLSSRFSLANLEGMALCLSADLPAKPLDAISASHIKKLTGDDVVSADRKYGSRQQFSFQGKLILATNYPLMTAIPDPAFMQRVVCVPFAYAVAPEDRDESLKIKIPQERAAIVSMAMDAYFRLRKNYYRFAGEYELNAPALFGPSQMDFAADPSVQIPIFLQQFYEPDETGIIEMVEIHRQFCNVCQMIPLATFSAKFVPLAGQLYGAEQVRNRMGGKYNNPRSCIRGIRERKN